MVKARASCLFLTEPVDLGNGKGFVGLATIRLSRGRKNWT